MPVFDVGTFKVESIHKVNELVQKQMDLESKLFMNFNLSDIVPLRRSRYRDSFFSRYYQDLISLSTYSFIHIC